MEPATPPENAVRIPEAPEHYLHIDQSFSREGRIVVFIHDSERDRFYRYHLGVINQPNLTVGNFGADVNEFQFTHTSERLRPQHMDVLAAAMKFVATVMREADSQLDSKREEIRAERERREKEHAAYMERVREERRKAREAEEARVAEVKEAVQWMIDQKFKLKRRGYKSTVFGTLKEVTPSAIRTISEKNVPMHIPLREIEYFAVKYEGDRQYTEIYKEKKEVTADAH